MCAFLVRWFVSIQSVLAPKTPVVTTEKSQTTNTPRTKHTRQIDSEIGVYVHRDVRAVKSKLVGASDSGSSDRLSRWRVWGDAMHRFDTANAARLRGARRPIPAGPNTPCATSHVELCVRVGLDVVPA